MAGCRDTVILFITLGEASIANIFISYRREDSADVTGRIRDRLVQEFGAASVFVDVDNIPLGVNFAEHIDGKVAQCAVLLAVIGRDWLTASEQGRRRIDEPNDYVRAELESALKRKIPVVPMLVRRASMPEAGDLPESIRELALRNGMPIRPDPDFHTDCDRLIEGLKAHLGTSDGDKLEPQPPPITPTWRRKVTGVAIVAAVAIVLGTAVWRSGFFDRNGSIERIPEEAVAEAVPDEESEVPPAGGDSGDEDSSTTDVGSADPEVPASTNDRERAFRAAMGRDGRVIFAADFSDDPVNAPPRAPRIGSWRQDTDAGTILVRRAVGDLTNKPVEFVQRDGLRGGVNLTGEFTDSPTIGLYIVSWRALVGESRPCFATMAVRDGDPVASVAFRGNGRITTGSGQEPFPVRWTEGVWQLFEVEIDLGAGTVDYRVDGVPMEGFQDLPITSRNPGREPRISTISMELGCTSQQAFAWDDIKVIRIR